MIPSPQADVYFTRLDLLRSRTSHDPIRLLGWSLLLKASPELLLAAVLRAFRVRVVTFPSTMLLSCCSGAGGCYSSYCHVSPTAHLQSLIAAPIMPAAAGAAAGRVSTERGSSGGGGITAMRSIRGKYKPEMLLAIAHSQALACPGAHYKATSAHPSAHTPSSAISNAASGGSASSVSAPPLPGVVVSLLGPPISLLADWHPDSVARRQLHQRQHLQAAYRHQHQQQQRPAHSSTASQLTHWSSPLQTPWVLSTDAPKPQARRWHRRLLLNNQHDKPLPWSAAADEMTSPTEPRDELPTSHSSVQAAGSSSAGSGRGSFLLAPPQCPDYPRQWWPRNATPGHCGPIEATGSCTKDSRGRFPQFRVRRLNGHSVSLADCARLCAGCERCTHFAVSLAAETVACQWYAEGVCEEHRRDRATRALRQHGRSTHVVEGLGGDQVGEEGLGFVTASLVDALRGEVLCRARYGRGVC